CGLNGNTDTICSPKSGDTWKNGTWYPISWNPLYPTYVSTATLDIYIYIVQNYQNRLIKKFLDIPTSKANYPILVDDNWRLDNKTNATLDGMVYLVSSGVDPEKEMNNIFTDFPPPVHFNVEQLAIPPISTSLPTSSSSASSITSSTHPASLSPSITKPTAIPSNTLDINNAKKQQQDQQQSDQQGQHTIQPWVIAAVVLSCLAVLGACATIFWVTRNSRRRKLVYGEKGHVELNSTASMFPTATNSLRLDDKVYDNRSVVTAPMKINTTISGGGSKRSKTAPNTPASAKPKFGFISTPSLPMDEVYGAPPNLRPQSAVSISNASSRSEPPLTSTDALLIADTFRQRMRRPEWQSLKPEEVEQLQRQQSDDLLKKELEAEGTLMKKVGKSAIFLANN
ncbi:hypothetical protein K501DRAFT_169767, partial [Backusella circina FSU 941]